MNSSSYPLPYPGPQSPVPSPQSPVPCSPFRRSIFLRHPSPYVGYPEEPNKGEEENRKKEGKKQRERERERERETRMSIC